MVRIEVATLLAEFQFALGDSEAGALAGRVLGPMVRDAKVAALRLTHGVTEFWTADRDFSCFPSPPVRNPLLREH